MALNKRGEERRFNRRLFETISDYQRQIDELKQSREVQEAGTKFPAIDFDNLPIGETFSSNTTLAADANAAYDEASGRHGYDYSYYR